MTTLAQNLKDRTDQFEEHLNFAKALDQTLFEGEPIIAGDTTLTVTHLLTIKAGLIVHLYNIVEAVMTQTIEKLGQEVLANAPSDWSTHILKEWLRFNASITIEGNEESRLDIVHKAARRLLTKETIADLKFKKPSGSWSDKVIYRFTERLNVEFKLTPEIARKISPSSRYGDETPLVFLAKRRNAIAHGTRSFEEGASDLSLIDIQTLAEITIEYMELAVHAFQTFLDNKSFLEAET